MPEPTRPKSRRALATTILIVAAVALVGIAAVTFSAGRNSPSAEAVGPIDLRFTYFDGSEGTLAALRGKPVVLNFWASWCPTCAAEMPDFQQVSQRFAGQVEFIGINVQDVSRDAALQLVEASGVRYRLADDPTGAIFQKFGGVAMPTTVLINSLGQVTRVHAGALFANDLVMLIEKDLLAR